jgi:hypothetical protein
MGLDGDLFCLGKRANPSRPCKVVGGKIIVNQAVLGHEMTHLLHFKDPEVVDPDTLDRLERRAARSGRC